MAIHSGAVIGGITAAVTTSALVTLAGAQGGSGEDIGRTSLNGNNIAATTAMAGVGLGVGGVVAEAGRGAAALRGVGGGMLFGAVLGALVASQVGD